MTGRTVMAMNIIRRGHVGMFCAPAILAAVVAAGTGSAQDLPAAAVAEAQSIWEVRCSTCHGAGGKGDGPLGASLTPKPRDLSSPDWQKSATDEHIEKIIAAGGPAVGMSVLMPGNPDLAGKPDVIKALRAKVRSLAAP
ncbi:MAG TPA: c-type cytochrome [Candidatus Limnocylindrales bacterium]|nr:c-type cytochrome [Candidatus Limnocylindrales bacterium]